MLVHPLHKAHVEIPQSAVGVCLFDLPADNLAAGDDDLIAARDPQHALGDALDKAEVLLVMAGAVGIHAGLIGGGVALIALDGDDDVLTRLDSGLTHLTANQRHRGEPGV